MKDKSEHRILVVDDDLDLQQITTHLLRKNGYAVTTANDGQDCLNKIRLDQPHLILLDVVLPDISGMEVCRVIKQDPLLSGIHVLMYSGLYTGPENISEGLEAGADGYLIKPLNVRELLARGASFRLIAMEMELRESG